MFGRDTDELLKMCEEGAPTISHHPISHNKRRSVVVCCRVLPALLTLPSSSVLLIQQRWLRWWPQSYSTRRGCCLSPSSALRRSWSPFFAVSSMVVSNPVLLRQSCTYCIYLRSYPLEELCTFINKKICISANIERRIR